MVGTQASAPGDRVLLKAGTYLGEDFSGRRLSDLTIVESRFDSCHFDRIVTETAIFGAGRAQSVYTDCSFVGLKVQQAIPVGNARFVRCDFRNVNLKKWFSHAAEYVDCVFSGTIQKAVFDGEVSSADREFLSRSHNEFSGNDFRGVTLRDVSFRTGVELHRQLLPGPPEYTLVEDLDAGIAAAEQEVATWDDAKLQARARAWLNVSRGDLAKGQGQILVNMTELTRFLRGSGDHASRLAAALQLSTSAGPG